MKQRLTLYLNYTVFTPVLSVLADTGYTLMEARPAKILGIDCALVVVVKKDKTVFNSDDIEFIKLVKDELMVQRYGKW